MTFVSHLQLWNFKQQFSCFVITKKMRQLPIQFNGPFCVCVCEVKVDKLGHVTSYIGIYLIFFIRKAALYYRRFIAGPTLNNSKKKVDFFCKLSLNVVDFY